MALADLQFLPQVTQFTMKTTTSKWSFPLIFSSKFSSATTAATILPHSIELVVFLGFREVSLGVSQDRRKTRVTLEQQTAEEMCCT